VILEKKSFKGKVDARQMTDAAPCYKLTWPFRPGELKTSWLQTYGLEDMNSVFNTSYGNTSKD